MKSKIVRLAVVLALVVSLFAIAAPPVAAVTTVVATVSPTTAGAAAQYTVTFLHTAVAPVGTTITLTFPAGTTLPSSIAKANWKMAYDPIAGGTTAAGAIAVLAAPAVADPDVVVSGNAIQVPVIAGQGTAGAEFIAIQFSQLAGIRNPMVSTDAATTYTINVASSVGGEVSLASGAYVIDDFVTFSPLTAAEGGAVTVTGGGFSPGATIRRTAGPVSASGTVAADGTFSIAGTRTSAVAATITMTDGTGRAATSTAALALTPSMTASPVTGKAQDLIRLTGKNFTAASNIAAFGSVSIGGVAVAVAANVIPVNPAAFGGAFTDMDGDGVADDFTLDIRIPSAQLAGTYTVAVTDAAAAVGTTTVAVTGRSVTLSPSSGPPGTRVVVTGANFPAGIAAAVANTLTAPAAFLAAAVTGLETDANGSTTSAGTVLGGAPSGAFSFTVTIVGADAVASTGTATFTVTARPLTLSPATGPRGTRMTLTGSGFTAGGEVDPNNVVANAGGANGALGISGVVATILAAGQGIGIDTAGNLPATTVTIPALAPTGAQTITATDNTARVGQGTFMVTQPTIAISPATGTLGTGVTVTGSGWVPNTNVTITYAGTSTTATANATGTITALVTIPSTVGLGPAAVNFGANDGATLGNAAATVVFTVPASSLTVSPASVSGGAQLTVTGTGFVPGVGVSTLTIGGASVLPAQAIVTDSVGGFSVPVTVPLGLTGTQAVNAAVGAVAVNASTSVVVVAAAATVGTQLSGIAGKYTAVWGFDAATQSWKLSDPAQPALSDLANLTRGGGYWINATEATTLVSGGNSYALFAGWNLIGFLG